MKLIRPEKIINLICFRIFLLGFIVLSPFFLSGAEDTTKADSLVELSGNNPAILTDSLFSDNEKYLIADRLSQVYGDTAVDKALVYDRYLIKTAVKNGDTISISKFLFRYYKHQNQLCNFEKADSALKALKPYFVNNNDQRKLADFYLLMAQNYYDWSRYKKSAELYKKARLIYEKLRIKPEIAKCLKAEGAIWSGYGDYEKAIGLLQRSRDIYTAIGDEAGLAALNNTMGVVMQNWGKLDRSLEYYTNALKYYKKKRDLWNELNMYLHIGDVYRLKKELGKALSEFRKSERLSRKVNHKKLISIVYSNLGEVFYDMGNYDSALYYQNLALPLKYEVGDRRRIVISLSDLMKIYIKKHEYDKAIKTAHEALNYAAQINANDIKMDTYLALSKMYAEKNNYKEAYKYLQKYHNIEKVVFNEKSRKMINELEVKYEAARKEKENALLKKENALKAYELRKEEDRRNYLIIFLVFIVSMTLVIVLFVNYRNRTNRKHIAVLEKKNKEITEASEKLKTTYDDLKVSQERYRSIVENATIGMYRTRKDGKILYANKTLLNMLGYKESELMKIDLNVEKKNRNEFIELLERQEIITGREDLWHRADGSEMWVNESAWIIRNNKGKILYYEGIVEDITKRKHAEKAAAEYRERLEKTNIKLRNINKEIEAARKEAEEANRAKSEFLANISHEIRTPLNSIVGFTDLLESRVNNPEDLNYIHSIQMSSNNLLRLINDILDLSKIQAGKLELVLEPVYLVKLVEEIRHIFYPQVEKKNLEFIIESKIEKDLSLFLDITRIRQVLFNIIGNAIKFTDKGSVRLTVYAESCENRDKERKTLHIEVEDTGIGIDLAELDAVFDAFTQSKSNVGKNLLGTGLGLSISKKLVELMGGTISVESVKGKGSLFIITIPCLRSSYSLEDLKTGLGDKKFKFTREKDDYTEPLKEKMDKDVSNEFKENLEGLLTDSLRSHLLSDIDNMAQKMMLFASEHNLENLKQHATLIKEAADRFDIERMEFYMSKLIKFYYSDKK